MTAYHLSTPSLAGYPKLPAGTPVLALYDADPGGAWGAGLEPLTLVGYRGSSAVLMAPSSGFEVFYEPLEAVFLDMRPREGHILAELALSFATTKETIMSNQDATRGSTSSFPDTLIEAAARAAHEVNRAWCLAHGDTSQKGWDEAPAWQRESCVLGVRGVVAGNGPRESHEGWLAHKEAEGWTYGPVKDVENKRHPCMVDYDDLPPEQHRKDTLFVGVVRLVLGLGGA